MFPVMLPLQKQSDAISSSRMGKREAEGQDNRMNHIMKNRRGRRRGRGLYQSRAEVLDAFVLRCVCSLWLYRMREGEMLVGRENLLCLIKTWGVRQPVDLRVSVIFWFSI
jgi:hypothetical protein